MFKLDFRCVIYQCCPEMLHLTVLCNIHNLTLYNLSKPP